MRPKSLFGSDLGQKGPIEGPKHRFNPLKTQLTPIFNEYNHPPTHRHQRCRIVRNTMQAPLQSKSAQLGDPPTCMTLGEG